ncbi:aminopeptidase P family N-terminal domain-containing protein [Desemzia incerta]|uniref:M24 family metallopeptidase n=1 Tax=Desemzia incerta TaxID=82801 RepID=UPI0024C27D23|nr:aminopeptidase P family N-terminal domain-containing protein [Desemzia incerta]WHZ32464.1 aminopeptidase P family N-terminal domain-containing protein [Desemzia incerta]
MTINLNEVALPTIHTNLESVILSNETMTARKENFLAKMKQQSIDTAIIYADREHGANFEYLTGFIPRFEEACLVIHSNGDSYLMLGNENLKLAAHSRIPAKAVHVPYFSLPNQPMTGEKTLADHFKECHISPDATIGVIGWKLFTSSHYDNGGLFDLPFYVVDSLIQYVSDRKHLQNFASALISPEGGLRTTHNANEIAHFEYGATLAGKGMFEAIQAVEVGKTEKEIGAFLAQEGQPNTVTTISAAGQRFTHATLYPRDNKASLGDNYSMTVGYKGGLSSRAGFVAASKDDLPENQSDYLEKVGIPYFTAYTAWLENIKVGTVGDEFYSMIQEVFPSDVYGWTLNPGHYTGDDEWMSSPFFKGSNAVVKSGQMFQVDIIPSVPGYSGASCEEPVAIADEALQAELKESYPEVWNRIETRRNYIKNVIKIDLSDDVLPLSDTVAFYTPFFLNKTLAYTKEA